MAKWFGEELDSAGFHGTHGHRYVAMAGDEDDRDRNAGLGEFAPESQATEVRQPHVQH
jgi:hypothetical protein